MRTLFKTAVVLLGLSAVLVGLSFNVLRAQDLGPRDKATRVMANDERSISADVDTIKLEGSIDLVLKQGAKPSIQVFAEQRLLPNIQTIQEGNVLRIATKGLMINVRKPMRVEMTLPTLKNLIVSGSGDSIVTGFSGDALQVSLRGSGDVQLNGKYRQLNGSLAGSGDLHFDGADSDSVELTLQGSGDVHANGKTKALSVKLMGSGDLDGSDLKAESVSVNIMGSGDAQVYAKNDVTISIMGSGGATVSGGPTKRNVSKMGSGDASFE